MSIESKGVLEPLLVKPVADGRYRIIAGERRFRAAMEAGLTEVPCIELDVPENEVVEIALIENLHRRDLHPFEEAEGYASLAARHGYTQQQIADAVGKVARLGDRDDVPAADPGGVAGRMSARRHRREVRAPADRAARRSCEDAGRDRLRRSRIDPRRSACLRRNKRRRRRSVRRSSPSCTDPAADRSSSTCRSRNPESTRAELIDTLRGIIRQLEAGDIPIHKKK